MSVTTDLDVYHRQPSEYLGHSEKPFAVVDTVKVWVVNNDTFWSTELMSFFLMRSPPHNEESSSLKKKI
jgi:hypothetical protein